MQLAIAAQGRNDVKRFAIAAFAAMTGYFLILGDKYGKSSGVRQDRRRIQGALSQQSYHGIVDIASFNKAKRKILWILKEGNDPEQTSWSLQDVILNYLKESKYWLHTFGLICQLSWAILNDVEDLEKVPPAKDITDTLKQIAVINVKKIGGKSTADCVDVKRFYNEHKALIKEQIEAIEPDIIISCNGIQNILSDFKTKGEILNVGHFRKAAYKNGVIIGAYHPAQRSLPHAAYFKNIWDCLKQG